MKNVLFILFLVPFISLGQYVPPQNQYEVKVKTEKSVSESFTDGIKAGAAARAANAELAKAAAAKSAAMNTSMVDVKVPLSVDVNNYTHIALVGVTYAFENGVKVSGSDQYKNFSQLFANSPLTVINPYKQDKRRARKDNRFLREVKNPKTLYMYYETSMVGVNSHRTLVVRDYQNKIVYRAKAINIDKSEMVDPFIYF